MTDPRLRAESVKAEKKAAKKAAKKGLPIGSVTGAVAPNLYGPGSAKKPGNSSSSDSD